MWLSNSSVGRKVVMSVTGLFLILFVTFHVLMNAVALLSPEAYNVICRFLGANWYALVGTLVLAAGFALHIIYSFWVSWQNTKARGNDAYAINKRPKSVEWASQNMLVLGIIVLCFLLVHLLQFWYRMQWREIVGPAVYNVDGVAVHPDNGAFFLYMAFKNWWTLIVYLIGFAAIWFHMTHGFWSAFQSLGVNNNIWMGRLRHFAMWWASIVCLLFAAEAIWFTIDANRPAQESRLLEAAYEEASLPVPGEINFSFCNEACGDDAQACEGAAPCEATCDKAECASCGDSCVCTSDKNCGQCTGNSDGKCQSQECANAGCK